MQLKRPTLTYRWSRELPRVDERPTGTLVVPCLVSGLYPQVTRLICYLLPKVLD
jgi:hypothetical protein